MKYLFLIIIAGSITAWAIRDARESNAKLLDLRAKEADAVADRKIERLREDAGLPLHPDPTPAPRTQWTRDELVIVHGRVLRVQGDTAVVQCTGPDHGPNPHLDASAGAAASKQMAMLALRQELQNYGQLKVIEGGTLRDASWRPRSTASGEIQLQGVRLAPETNVHIIAAPLGGQLYTAVFSVPPEPRGAWMWQNRDNPLNQQGHR